MLLTVAFLFLVAVIFESRVTGNPVTPSSQEVSNSQQELFSITENDSERVNELIEKVKARILNNLHLKKVPRVHGRIPELQTLSANQRSEPVDYLQTEMENKILQATINGAECFDEDEHPCIRFQIELPQSLESRNYPSVELWVYKKSNVRRLKIAQTIHNDSRTVTHQADNQPEPGGWTRFDARSLLNSALQSGSRIVELTVSSELTIIQPLETGPNEIPFLMIFDNETHSVAKRSVRECTDESVSCCRQTLHINFHDIGWDWVIQPKRYEANFCKGSCRHEVNLARHQHTTVLMLWLERADETSRAGVSVHCVPGKLKSTPLIHMGENGIEVNMHLPNMTVEECSCA